MRPETLRPDRPESVRPRGLRIDAVGKTDVGLLREKNEDRLVVRDDLGLYLVADGMGGHACGDVAATLAADTMERVFSDAADARATGDDTEALDARWNQRTDEPSSGPSSAASTRLATAVRRANQRIHSASWRDPEKHGMGTTLTAMLTQGSWFCVAHVGDSRAYRLRGAELEQITEDHTFANDCIRRGISPAIAMASMMGNALTRALGLRGTVEVDVHVGEALPGDVILLCSDGVCGVLEPEQIAAAMTLARRDLAGAAEQIIDRVLDEGAPDNATCVLVRWG